MPPKKSPTKKVVAKSAAAPKKVMSKKVASVAAKSTPTQPKASPVMNLLDNGPKFKTPHIKHEVQQYFAEFIGTAILTFAVTLNLGSGEMIISTPILAGIVLGLLVYTIGSVSGAHVNPAVTLAMFVTRKLHYKTAIFYILAQVTGAMFAVAAFVNLGLTLPAVYSIDAPVYFAMEAIAAAILVFGVSAVVNKKVSESASGLVVGGSLLAGVTFAANYSLGIANPALALSWGLINYTYLLGPIVGALIAACIYKLLVWK